MIFIGLNNIEDEMRETQKEMMYKGKGTLTFKNDWRSYRSWRIIVDSIAIVVHYWRSLRRRGTLFGVVITGRDNVVSV